MASPSAARSFLGTVSLVFIAIGVIFAADMFLAQTERAESRVQAARLFKEGQAALARGDNAGAIERLKDAVETERGNRDYLRTLAQAQLAAGKTAGAESTLTGLLETDSTDGLANLIMARVLVKDGRFEEAVSYFHRAVDGHWDQDAAGNQLRARLELIDLLAQRNSKDELLAELLPLEDRRPDDPKTWARLGRLYLVAGSPARAAVVFRGILHEAPSNADAHDGLGEAEFAQRQYRVAQREFQAALRLAPGDEAARKSLDLCDELLALDPTLRGLGQAERYQRSLKIVALTQGEVSRCAGTNPAPDVEDLLDAAARAQKAHLIAARQGDAVESNLDLAERIWQLRQKECKQPPGAGDPLALVMARVSQ